MHQKFYKSLFRRESLKTFYWGAPWIALPLLWRLRTCFFAAMHIWSISNTSDPPKPHTGCSTEVGKCIPWIHIGFYEEMKCGVSFSLLWMNVHGFHLQESNLSFVFSFSDFFLRFGEDDQFSHRREQRKLTHVGLLESDDTARLYLVWLHLTFDGNWFYECTIPKFSYWLFNCLITVAVSRPPLFFFPEILQ